MQIQIHFVSLCIICIHYFYFKQNKLTDDLLVDKWRRLLQCSIKKSESLKILLHHPLSQNRIGFAICV
jgi:hypothetical protein